MSLIKCPKCHEEISDKSDKCVHCGHALSKKTKLLCEECKAEISGNEEFCSKCGCPVDKKNRFETQKLDRESIQLNNRFSKKKIIIVSIVFLLVLGVVSFIAINKYNDNLSKKYRDNLSMIAYEMLSGAADAETCANKIKKVWSNTIWEESDSETDKYTKTNGWFNDDFNDSLDALFSDSSFSKLTDDVKENQKSVNKYMKEMKNPPEEWKDAYSDLKDYYDSYLKLTNLCVNPSGSLQTYSTNFSDADTAAVNGYDKIKSYLDY